MTQRQKLTKYACYATNISMAAVANITPLLFSTFYTEYGISYSLLGLLVMVNFITQLSVDLILSFFYKKFNIKFLIKSISVITFAGMAIFALMPLAFPDYAYIFIAVGTWIFALSGGMSEVLASPIIAALPSDNPEREMSKLHSVYAWGAAGVVVITTLLLEILGKENWYIVVLLWSFASLVAEVLFIKGDLPDLQRENTKIEKNTGYKKWLAVCVLCIFLGGISESTMAQWCSAYIEQALGISKIWGDMLGVALFSVFLGTGRTLYAKFGKDVIGKVLIAGFGAAFVCYAVSAASSLPVICLIACALTGFCVSMLWPGTIIFSEKVLVNADVTVYALLASGGDLGGSVGPQLVGSVTDLISESKWASSLDLSITAEQFGLKIGMGVAAVFPLIGCVLAFFMYKRSRTK